MNWNDCLKSLEKVCVCDEQSMWMVYHSFMNTASGNNATNAPNPVETKRTAITLLEFNRANNIGKDIVWVVLCTILTQNFMI